MTSFPVWKEPAVITLPGEPPRLSRERGTEEAGVGGAPPSASSRSGKLGGQLFTAPTDGSDFFFFFSPMETLNHVSAFPVMYIGHDSYQGGLPLPAQTHQPTKDAGH